MPHPHEQHAHRDDEQPQSQPKSQPQHSPPQHRQRRLGQPPAHHPNLECGNWQLLSPPGDYHRHPHRRRQHDEERLQIGLIQCHPSLSRLAYTTRRPAHLGNNDDEDYLGSSQVVIQDYEDTLSHECPDANGRVVCAFFLRELVEQINDHRSTRSPGAAPLTASLLGAVQHLAFLDREALREVVPRHLVRDDPSPDGMHKLLVGFRRCLVAVSLFRRKDQSEPHARGIAVRAFLGPEDPRQYRAEDDGEETGSWSEAAMKQWKRQPASFAAPVSEHVLAYGCYDGGLRFYDAIGKRQAKSALGPNGRNVPVVKVIHANPSRTSDGQPRRPRILCAGANGVGYLWELDLSVDTATGQITHFDIPPPLATFDGLAALVRRTLSEDVPPSDLLPLAPTSTHSQMDRFHSQFEPTFDPHRNLLVWTFSSAAIAAATRRRDACGYLLAWDLTAVPPPSWPPPAQPPATVAPLPSPDMTCRLTVPGIANHVENLDSFLVSAYVATSSGELMAFVVDVDVDSPLFGTADDVTDCELAEVSKYGNRCYSLAKATNQPYQIFLGTQHGILMARIAASHDELDHDLFTIGEDQSVMELESLSYCSIREEEYNKKETINEKENKVATPSPSRHQPNEFRYPPAHASANYDDREDQSYMDLESLSHFSYQTQDYVKPPPRPLPPDDPPPPLAKPTLDATDVPAPNSNSSEIQRLKTKLSQLELRNAELEEELQRTSLLLETPSSTTSTSSSDPRQLALKARMATLLQHQRKYQDMAKKEVEASRTQLEKMEHRLSSQEEKYHALHAEAEQMRRELTNVGNLLEKERSLNQSANAQWRALMAEVKNLEEKLASMTSWKEELEVENAEWSRRWEETRNNTTAEAATNNGSLGGASPSISSNNSHGDSSKSKEPHDAPNEAVKAAEEADLRSYIHLLEDDKHAKDKELEEARFDAEEDAKLIAKLQADAREQTQSIESLVQLLDGEKQNYHRELAAKTEEMESLREELEVFRKKLEEEVMNSSRVVLQCRAGNDKIASQREEIERLRLENLAVRRELQDALDELKVYRK